MTTANTVEIAPDIFWVGVKDWHRRLFDALVPLPQGTSYNAYLVRGQAKTALIDTVEPSFADSLLDKVSSLTDVSRLDYLIMNHAEPDHAGSIPRLLAEAPQAKLVVSKRGLELAQTFHRVDPERALVVKEGDSLDLGGKTLRFIDAPFLHWPETMFTYCPEEGTLFPCDFFGGHVAPDRLFADEMGPSALWEAKRYYAEIIMPFARPAARALDKLAGLDIKVIAPSHGPVYRQPSAILNAYEGWVRGPLEAKALIIYVSMWGSTHRIAQAIVESISRQGVTAIPYELTSADTSHIARDLVDAAALVMGSPTFVGGAHPLVAMVLNLARILKPRAPLAAVFGSYGWGSRAVARMSEELQGLGLEVVDRLEVSGPPQAEDLARADSLGGLIASRVKEVVGQ
jgi:flavorubredoxin